MRVDQRQPAAKGKYYEAQCIDVDPVKKVVKCQYSKPFKCDGMYPHLVGTRVKDLHAPHMHRLGNTCNYLSQQQRINNNNPVPGVWMGMRCLRCPTMCSWWVWAPSTTPSTYLVWSSTATSSRYCATRCHASCLCCAAACAGTHALRAHPMGVASTVRTVACNPLNPTKIHQAPPKPPDQCRKWRTPQH